MFTKIFNRKILTACAAMIAACDEVDEPAQFAAATPKVAVGAVILAEDEVSVVLGEANPPSQDAPDWLADSAPNPEAVSSLNGSVAQGAYWKATLNKAAGVRYTVCIRSANGGNADLYGDWVGFPTTSSSQQKSTNAGSASECLRVDSTNDSPYFFSVYGKSSTTFEFWWSGTTNYVPADLTKKLKRPTSCIGYTHTTYGPFNSPWGNTSEQPFYNGMEGRLHNGTDFACAPGTTVKAVCSGEVKYTGKDCQLADKWGYCVVQECKLGSTTFTVAYDHLNDSGRASAGAITAGGTIGKVWEVESKVTGEKNHLHLGICMGDAGSCFNVAKGGAVSKSLFPGPMINSNAPNLWAP